MLLSLAKTWLSNHAGGSTCTFLCNVSWIFIKFNKRVVEITVIKLFAYNQLIKNGPYDVTVPRETLSYWRVVMHVTVVAMFKSVFLITVVAFFLYKLLAVISSYKAFLGRFFYIVTLEWRMILSLHGPIFNQTLYI